MRITTIVRVAFVGCVCLLIQSCGPTPKVHHFYDVRHGKVKHIGVEAKESDVVTPAHQATISFLTYFPVAGTRYDVVPMHNGTPILDHALVYDVSLPSHYEQLPANPDVITEIRFYPFGRFTAANPDLNLVSKISIVDDADLWQDDASEPQNGSNKSFYIVWSPTVQAIVIMDDDLSGGAKN